MSGPVVSWEDSGERYHDAEDVSLDDGRPGPEDLTEDERRELRWGPR